MSPRVVEPSQISNLRFLSRSEDLRFCYFENSGFRRLERSGRPRSTRRALKTCLRLVSGASEPQLVTQLRRSSENRRFSPFLTGRGTSHLIRKPDLEMEVRKKIRISQRKKSKIENSLHSPAKQHLRPLQTDFEVIPSSPGAQTLLHPVKNMIIFENA